MCLRCPRAFLTAETEANCLNNKFSSFSRDKIKRLLQDANIYLKFTVEVIELLNSI